VHEGPRQGIVAARVSAVVTHVALEQLGEREVVAHPAPPAVLVVVAQPADVTLHGTPQMNPADLSPPIPPAGADLHGEGAVVLGQALVEPARHAREVVVHQVVDELVEDDREGPGDTSAGVEGEEIAVGVAEEVSEDDGAAAVGYRFVGRVGLAIAEGDDLGRRRVVELEPGGEAGEDGAEELQVGEDLGAARGRRVGVEDEVSGGDGEPGVEVVGLGVDGRGERGRQEEGGAEPGRASPSPGC